MWQDLIAVDPEILVGKPVLTGTRLAVEFVLDLMAGGCPEDEIMANYPGLTHEHLKACVAYAADLVRSERVYPLGA